MMRFRQGQRVVRGCRALTRCLAALVWCAPVVATASAVPLRAGSEIDYPPFCIVDQDGHPDGFSVALLKATLALMGREATFRVGPWPQVRGWLEHGEVDVLPLVGRTPERDAIFDFTFPYMSLHGAIVTRADSTGLRAMEDLRGLQVAVMAGDNAEEFLRREERGLRIHTTDTFETALRELAAGKHDAVVMQRLVALRLINTLGLDNLLRMGGVPLDDFRQDFCFAVHKGDAATLALLNEGLALAMADGTFRRLHAQWFSALELPADRPIIIGGDHEYPPYEFLDKRGRPAGYNVELSRAIARELGLNVLIRLGTWSQVLRQLEHGQIDVIQGIFFTPARDRIYDFSPAHDVNHYVGVGRQAGLPPPEHVEALGGRKVAVQAGDAIYAYLEDRARDVEWVFTETQSEVLQAVAEGRADFGLAVRRIALQLMEQKGLQQTLTLGSRPLATLDYGFAVRKGDRALLAEFSEGLELVRASGELHQLREKWLGLYEPQGRVHRQVLRMALLAIAVLAGFLLLALLGVWGLRRLVYRRTALLRASEGRFRSLFENHHAVMLVSDPSNGRIVDANPAAAEYYGWPRERLRAMKIADINTLSSERLEGEMEQALRRERRLFSYRHRLADGSIRDVDVFSGPVHDGNRELLYSLVFDVTARHEADRRVEHLNRVLRAIRDVNQLIVREQDREHLIREACSSMVENRSYRSALLVLTNAQGEPEHWATAGKAAETDALEAMLKGGRLPPCCHGLGENVSLISDRKAICGACPLICKNPGTESLCIRLRHGAHDYGFLLAAQDLELGRNEEELELFSEMAGDLAYALHGLQVDAERETLATQLEQAARLESVGRLAGGVAHDFNNMLMGIMNYTELSLDRLGPGHIVREWLNEIMATSERSARIVRQLLMFARRQPSQPYPLDLNEAINGMTGLLKQMIGRSIELVWRPQPEACRVLMDPAQLDQILTNLCINARDAISGAGKVTLRTSTQTLTEASGLLDAEAAPGRYVLLTVEDDGSGIDPEVVPHVFEPFFTTKAPGEGTGLGLSTVYGIIKQNGGFITIQRPVGGGTRFLVYLPLCPAG